jgi:hypothetical protein
MMTEERVIYEKNNIKITNMRAFFVHKTYAISSITSVRKKEKVNPLTFWPLATIVFGIALIILAFNNDVMNWGMVMLGVFVVIGGGSAALLNNAEYSVQIGSASGETTVFKSVHIDEVVEIIQALNQAIEMNE